MKTNISYKINNSEEWLLCQQWLFSQRYRWCGISNQNFYEPNTNGNFMPTRSVPFPRTITVTTGGDYLEAGIVGTFSWQEEEMRGALDFRIQMRTVKLKRILK